MHLHLLLTGRCNLSCDYCFQTGRRVRPRMKTSIAEAALDTVLGAADPPHSVAVSGGEPFLSPALLRAVLSLIRARHGEDGRVACSVLTNGTLTTDDDIDFLARHDVSLQVSFDGVEPTQTRRAPDTHRQVLGRLERALERRPAWAREHLSVAMIVQAATVDTLARSVEELLSAGIGDIQIGPLTTHDPGWTRRSGERLAEQVERVAGVSRGHRERTGEVPVSFLNSDRRTPRSPGRRPRGALCGVTSPESVTVDPEGRAWACPPFVGSMQRVVDRAHEVWRRLDLGSVLAPAFRRRLARLPQEAGRLPLLMDKGRKVSVRGPCSDCPVLAQCLVCPASTVHAPGNGDPHRIPDNQCDFQFVTLKARGRFLMQTEASFAPPFFRQAPLAHHGQRRVRRPRSPAATG